MSDSSPRHEGEVLTRQDPRTKEPPMFRVILLNDDYTTMEFVVLVLESVFRKSRAEAQRIMLAVHEKGAAVAGVFTKEVAETKIATVHHLATENEFPLKCRMEPV
ncbi:MAG: ATP-dependent Clp protease adapter ClpS [Bdellovibrionales bacterium]|nr:ATP-dependent Clp protease adapter ClpS [Bdellovibrionales bacterium]